MSKVNFNAKDEDIEIIISIAKRAAKLHQTADLGRLDQIGLQMDITATHLNGCPLKLKELLNADDINFVHDVFGIQTALDRSTGKLKYCFSPRFSQ